MGKVTTVSMNNNSVCPAGAQETVTSKNKQRDQCWQSISTTWCISAGCVGNDSTAWTQVTGGCKCLDQTGMQSIASHDDSRYMVVFMEHKLSSLPVSALCFWLFFFNWHVLVGVWRNMAFIWTVSTMIKTTKMTPLTAGLINDSHRSSSSEKIASSVKAIWSMKRNSSEYQTHTQCIFGPD